MLPTTSKSESIGVIHWKSMAFQNRSMSLSAFRMAYWQHQRGDSDVSAGPSPGSSEHCCSGASTFEGTTHHASYFNSMWWATFCTMAVKLQHRNGDTPVKRWTNSMAMSVITKLQSRYIRDDHNMVVSWLKSGFLSSSHISMEKRILDWDLYCFSYWPFPFKPFSYGCYSFWNRLSPWQSVKQIASNKECLRCCAA